MIRRLITVVAIAILLTACGSTKTPTPVPTSETSPTVNPNSPYPEPVAYPAPGEGGESTGGIVSSQIVAVGELPSSTSGGTVKGNIKLGSPLMPIQLPLYLAEIIYDQNNQRLMAGMDNATAPQAFLDTEGNFVFINVPANEYALLVDLIVSTVILSNPATGETLIFEVTEGGTVDLGSLEFPDLSTNLP